MKMPLNMSKDAVMDAMVSLSDEAGGVMEEGYQYMAQKPYPLVKGAKAKVCHCCFLPTVLLSFVVALMLH